MPDTFTPTIVPCFACGDEYLSTPGAVDRWRASTAGNATGSRFTLLDGCECDGCATLRAALDAAPQAGSALPSLDEQYDAMVPVRLFVGPAVWERRTVTVLACPGCAARAETVRAERVCQGCGINDAEIFAVTGLTPVLDNGEALHGIEVGRVAASGRFRAVCIIDARPLVAYPDGYHCGPCHRNVAECDECGSLVHTWHECVECEIVACSDCVHVGCGNDEDGYRAARYSFTARSSIAANLAAAGTAGDTIRSTRAVGMEVESARGTVSEVTAAEALSVIPVIAAVGSDASVRGPGAVEYRLLPHRGAWAEFAIMNMHRWCREAGYRPDSSAGVHMHIDTTGMSVKAAWGAFLALASCEEVFLALATPSRDGNDYCRRLPSLSGALDQALGDPTYFEPGYAGIDSRYHTINAHAWSAHRTLEVRVFDSNHSPESALRYLDAAAVATGLVDLSATPVWADALAEAGRNGGTLPTPGTVLSMLADAGLISPETHLRVAMALLNRANDPQCDALSGYGAATLATA